MRIALLVLANATDCSPSSGHSCSRRSRATWPRTTGDGPWIVAALGAILLALLFLELGRGGLGPKTVALLGVLGAAMVALRLPGFVAGFSALFIVVLVAGNSLGPGFGFLLGCVGMFAERDLRRRARALAALRDGGRRVGRRRRGDCSRTADRGGPGSRGSPPSGS